MIELTRRERARLKDLVEKALKEDPESTTLSGLAVKLTSGSTPTFSKYAEVLEPAGDADREILARIHAAVESAGRVGIRYTAGTTGETTERVVRPFNIHFYDGREYLEAFCELRGADRVFAIGNIEAILPLSGDLP